MEKINFETLVSALFDLGFDKIDPILFLYTLGKLLKDDKEQLFQYELKDTSIGFDEYVDCIGITLRIKDGYTLDTNVSPNDSMVIPVRKVLFSNKKLLEYLKNFDFNEIVLKKAKTYGIVSANKAPLELFSDKEIKILENLVIEDSDVIKKQRKLI